MSSSDNNRRIAKNTMLLYVRMFITMVVSLYTSRVILHVLGIDDFGIYNLVGGVVVLFSFVNTAMITSTQRFLNFELGKSDAKSVARIFSASVTIHVGIVIFVIVCAETVGLWFLNTQLNIPEGRVYAANWAYQFSIAACCINVLKAPYNAAIIAHEKMSFYAYISIVETVLKLVIVYLLVLFTTDKLILYGFLIVAVSFIVFVWYLIYCIKSFGRICVYHFFYERDLYRQLLSFSGWSLFGSCANMGAQQGVGILLNIFYGVTINAAVGIANQVSSTLYGFVGNFQMAFSPQIVKLYATDARIEFMNLIFRTSKFSYYLMLLIALPVVICCGFILNIWLNIVPEYSIVFCQLMFAFLMIDALSAPLWISVQAIGNIKNYQILMGALIILNLPLAYSLLKLGFEPEYVYIIRIAINLVTVYARILYLKKKIQFPAMDYVIKVLVPCILVTLCSFPLPIYCNYVCSNWAGLIGTMLTSTGSIILAIYIFGITQQEKEFVKEIIMRMVNVSKK